MVEDKVQQQTFQQDPPTKKRLLYDAVSKNYNLGTYEEFEKKLNDPAKRKSLYDAVGKEYDLGTYQEFETKLQEKKNASLPSPSLGGQLPAQNKKLVGSVQVGTMENSADQERYEQLWTKDNVTTGLNKDEVEEYRNLSQKIGKDFTYVPEKDPIQLAQEADELNKKTITTNTGGAGSMMGGATSQEVPDEEAKAQSKKIKDSLKAQGIDADELFTETNRLTDADYQRIPKDKLLQDRAENHPFYQREVGHLNWTRDFGDKLKQSVDEGLITPEQNENIRHAVLTSLAASSVGDYNQQRSNINTVAGAIKNFGGADSDKILKDYAIEVSKVYGSSFLNGFDKAKEDTPEGKYLPTPEAQLGYQYIKDVDPEKAKQYERLFIDPKKVKDLNPDEWKGYNHFMQTLEETGIGLQQNAIKEELNNYSNIAKRNNGLTPEQFDAAQKLEHKNEELNVAAKQLDYKYPDRLRDKVSDAMQELMGQDIGYGRYAIGKLGLGVQHTAQGIWEAVSEPFMSPESNNMRELALMGQKIEEDQIYHTTDSNKGFLTDKLVFEPELRKQVDEIKDDKSLTKDQQESKLRLLLRDNSDKFGRVNIQGGELNISPSSILYGITDLGTSLLPFIALETATGGGATAGAVQKFLATFSAAAATGFHDAYSEAISKGKPQSEAYKEAMGITAINSFAMAGAGTSEAVKAMAGTKTAAGKLISQMSKEAIESVLNKSVPKGMRTVFSAIKDRIAATPEMIAGGLKSGAKFEAAMTLANEAKHQGYNTPIDREQNFKQSLLGIANFGILGGGLGHLGYKSPTELQKSSLLEFGKSPDEFTAMADQMHKDGKLSSEELDHRKMLIEKSAEAYKVLPKANDKGKPLTEKEKGNYLHETVIMNEGYKAAKTLPPKQAEKAEMTAMVADHKRDLILNPQPIEKLTKRKGQLEKSLVPEKDAEGKNIEIPEKEIFAAKAEIEAINQVLDEHEKTKPAEATTPTVSGEIDGKIQELNKKREDNLKGIDTPAKQKEIGVATKGLSAIKELRELHKNGEIDKLDARENEDKLSRLSDLANGRLDNYGEKIQNADIWNIDGLNKAEERFNNIINEKQRVNDYYDKEVAKLKSENKPTAQKEEVKDAVKLLEQHADNPMFMGMATPEQKLQYIAEQAQGISSTGEPHSTGNARGLMDKTFGKELVDAAIEKYPAKEPPPPTGEGTVDTGDEDVTSIKNSVTRMRRNEFNLKQEDETMSKDFGTTWQEAKDKIDNGYHTQDLVDELKKKPRAIGDVEDALLLHHQNTKEIELQKANEQINEAADKGDKALMQEASIRRARLLDELQDVYDVNKAAGRETARGLSARRMMVDRKYSLVNMMSEKRAANDGKPLTPEQETEIESLHKKIHETQTAFDEYVKNAEAQISKLQEKILDKPVKDKKGAASKLRELADKLDESTKGKTFSSVVPISPKMISATMRLVADAIDKGEDVVKAIKKAVEEIMKSNPGVDKDKLTKEINNAVIDSGINTTSKEKKQAKDFSGIVFDRNALKLKAEAQRAKDAFDIALKKDEAKKRGVGAKVQDTFIKWQRAFKLSNPVTMGKLAMAGITRLGMTPVEDLVGAGWGTILPKSLTSGAIGEGGGLHIKETAKAYKDGILEGMKDSWQILKKGGGGKSDLDVTFGNGVQLPPEAIDFFGQLHSATKAPIKRIIFERSLAKRLRRNIANGTDVSDPMVQTEIALGAYKDANRAIFMQDNKVTTGWQRMVHYFETVDKKTGQAPSKATATALQWLIPFVKVPTNIAAEIGTHVYGVPVGIGKIVYNTFTKGLENLSADEKDAILRNLKKGSLGAAALTLGYMNPQIFGGYYQDKEHRNKNDAKANSVKIFGVNIPAWLIESPIFQAMQVGATIRRVKDAKVKGETKGIGEGVMAGALGLAEHVPMIDQPMRILNAAKDPKERDWYVDELAKGTIEPALLQKIAEWTDPADKRNPTNLSDHLKMGIPGLREQVGEKKSGRR